MKAIFPPGSRYGSYRIERRIQGGMTGTVYQGVAKDGTPVALKFLESDDESVQAYFLNELALLRQAGVRAHPHIITYVNGYVVRQPYCLVTQFIVGSRELTDLLRSGVTPGLALQVVEQIGSALDYLHYGHPNAPVIHRDVKPSNILIAADGTACLIDLGAASDPGFHLEGEKGLGTPQYMPPEQYLGSEMPQSDQFALAMLAFQMLAGWPLLPLQTKPAQRRLAKLAAADNAPIRAALRHLPATAEVLARAADAGVERRYPTCEAFAYALRRALTRDGASLHVPTPPQLPSRPIPWGYIGMTAAAIIAIVLLTLSFVNAPIP